MNQKMLKHYTTDTLTEFIRSTYDIVTSDYTETLNRFILYFLLNWILFPQLQKKLSIHSIEHNTTFNAFEWPSIISIILIFLKKLF